MARNAYLMLANAMAGGFSMFAVPQSALYSRRESRKPRRYKSIEEALRGDLEAIGKDFDVATRKKLKQPSE